MKRKAFLGLAVSICLLLAWTGQAVADRMTKDELKDTYGGFLVYIEMHNPDQDPVVLGNGIVISADGHVLTDHHVIKNALPDRVMGRLGSKQASPLKLVPLEPHWPDYDAALLQFEDPPELQETPPVRAAPSIESPLRVLSFARQGVGLAADVANVRGRVENDSHGLWELSGSGYVGDSGSPLFDEAGNIVGLIRHGSVTGSVFHMQTIAPYFTQLSERVPIREGIRPDEALGFFIDTEFRSEEEVFKAKTQVIQPLLSSLREKSNGLAKRVEFLDSQNLPVPVADALKTSFDRTKLRSERKEEIKRHLNKSLAKDWLASNSLRAFYLTMVGRTAGKRVARQSVLRITFDDSSVEVTDLDEPTSYIFKSIDDKAFPDHARAFIHDFIREYPDAGKTGIILTRCLNLSGLDANGTWVYFAPERIGLHLEEHLQAHSDKGLHHYKVLFAPNDFCSKRATQSGDSAGFGSYINEETIPEVMIETLLWHKSGGSYRITTYLRHPWRHNRRHPDEYDRDIAMSDLDEFNKLAIELAPHITRDWWEKMAFIGK